MNPLKTIIKVSDPEYLWAMTNIHEDWRGTYQNPHHKATHGFGMHARAHFEWHENNYTGMFQKADNCVIRMANAALPYLRCARPVCKSNRRHTRSLGEACPRHRVWPSKWGDEGLFFRHTFFHDELMLLAQTDPSRAKKWEFYVNDAEQYKREGANLYWPFLPASAGNATRLAASMLRTDVTLV